MQVPDVMFSILKKAFKDFLEDGGPRMAAAMAYYTVFALAPLLVLVLLIAGTVVDPSELEGSVRSELSSAIGPEAADQVQDMLRHIRTSEGGGPLTTILSLAALIFGATGIFIQLQEALNVAWEVNRKAAGGVRAFLTKRVLSAAMVVLMAAVLLASVLLSALVGAFGDVISSFLPGGPSELVVRVLETGVSLVVVGALFAVVFKVVPDADVAWRDVWVGAAATAVLFVAGKAVIGLYFAHGNPGEVFGAAGALALILVFVYYASMIVFLGAELTQAWASEKGSGIRVT